jgi:starch synthase
MKILLASSELHPFSKTGGLADMVSALARALAKAGHEVGVVTPLYAGLRQRFPRLKHFDWDLNLALGTNRVRGEIWLLKAAPQLTYYFVDQPDYFQRDALYGDKNGDYPDNAARYIFFSKAVVHLARYLPWQPEIVHAHDWPTGLIPLMVLHQHRQEGWQKIPRICFTIHNLAYQGLFPASQFELTNLPWSYFTPQGAEFYGQLNCLKAGLVYANSLTTVSPRYAQEITTPEFGCGLAQVLAQRQDALTGILNGADYAEWKTIRNPNLQHTFTWQNLHGKAAEKRALQKELALPLAPRVPLFGNIGRLAEQKGIDLMLGALKEMLAEPIQFVQLGQGDAPYEKACLDLAQQHPNQAAVRIGFDHGLPHRIEAACDFYLMPSRYEPCGLNQIYSLRYGTIPIVRATGGLDDSVVDITESVENANGIKFWDYSVPALVKAMRKALALYQHPFLFHHYRKNAMTADFCWNKTAQKYLEVYRQS